MAHFGTSALSVRLIVRNFSPLPPSPSFHPCFIHFTRTHMIPLYLEQVSYERRNHLRLFRLGLTRVLLLFCFGMDGSFEFHTQLSQWNLSTSRFWPFNWRSEFSSWDSWKESVTARRLQHLWRRPRAKNPTLILVREKKSALLACLWLSIISMTHVALVLGWKLVSGSESSKNP